MIDIARIIFQPEVLVFLLPIIITTVAIGSSVYLKAQKLKAAQGLGEEEKALIKKLLAENEDLKERMNNVEGIVTGIDDELLSLKVGKAIESKSRSSEESK